MEGSLAETRIMLVDDEKRILETFSLLLKDIGYYVKTASNPDDALSLVSEDKFDKKGSSDFITKPFCC